MKRLSALLALLLLLLVGCNTQTEAIAPHATGFSCVAKGTYGGRPIAGALNRAAAGLLTLSLTEPATLSGLTLEWDGTAITLRMLGLSYTVSPEEMPEAALGARILAALDATVHGEGTGELTPEGTLRTLGEANGIAYTLYSDPDTGALLSLEVPGEELNLTFTDFQITG